MSEAQNISSFRRVIHIVPAVIIASCASDASKAIKTSEIEAVSYQDQKLIDPSVQACDNFYQHACGGWLKATEIPAGKTSFRLEEDQAQAANEKALRELLEGTEPGSQETDRLRTFFASCMTDPKKGTQADQAILASWSHQILGIKTRSAFWDVWQDLQKTGINALLAYSGEVDWSNWNSFQGHIHQGRLGLNLAVYRDTTENGRTSLAAYRAQIEQSLTAFNDIEKARKAAENIIRIETALAAASIPRQDMFDPERSKHPMKRSELESLAPSIPWAKYFQLVGNPGERPVNVTSPNYIKALHKILEKESVESMRDVLLWQWLKQMEPSLPTSRADEPGMRRQQCRMATIKALGVELSRQFAFQYIGPEARDEGKDIAHKVRRTMVDAAAAEWLSPKSRQETQEKIAMIDIKVGYPDEWPAVGTFSLGKDTFLRNVLAAQSYEQQRSWARAQRARNRSSWDMKVYPDQLPGMAAARLMISNGFPDAFSNSIILTAASIQKPRLDPAAPLEVQYGGFGSLVAHELVHVLELSQFDKTGAPRNLWTEADLAAHQSHRTSCLTTQAAEYKINGQPALDGTRTLDENVADLSGLRYAYRSMTQAVPNFDDQPDRKIKAQRFYYAYAHHWCTKEQAGPSIDAGHAPAEFRVNGPLANAPEFAEAFGCKESAKMVRPAAQRCSVW